MKVVPVIGKCSSTQRNIGLQFVNDGNVDYKVGGTYIPSGVAPGDTKSEQKDVNELYHGKFSQLGCPVCGNKYLFVCRECGTINCYNGKSGKIKCAGCNKTVEVPKSDGTRILASQAQGGGPVAVMLAIDISGSMLGDPLRDMKKAAIDSYLRKLGANVEVGLITFNSNVRFVSSLTKNKNTIIEMVDGLSAGGGTTGPLCDIKNNQSYASFRNYKGARYVVIFTDGYWADPAENKQAALALQQLGIQIIGIATKDADSNFIKSICNGSMIIERGQESAAFDFVLKQTKGNG